MRVVVAAIASLIVVVSASASDRPPQTIYEQWRQANEGCRGGSGEDPETIATCKHRSAIDKQMASAGWCYVSPAIEWRRCAR